jgi:hypothetical protein
VLRDRKGEEIDRNIKQASLRIVTTNRERRGAGVNKTEFGNSKQIRLPHTHCELKLSGVALLKMKVLYPVAENFLRFVMI